MNWYLIAALVLLTPPAYVGALVIWAYFDQKIDGQDY
jgi:hypothetical protein